MGKHNNLGMRNGCNNPVNDSNNNFDISLYFQNVRSVMKDVISIQTSLATQYYQILIFVETWLDDTISDSEIDSFYTIYRHDRNNRGGGILIAISPRFRTTNFFISPNLELMCIILYIYKTRIFIVALYLPPPNNSNTLEKLEADIDYIIHKMNTGDKLIISGDFNFPLYNFNNNYIDDTLTNKFISFFLSHSLNQYVTFPTRNQNFLDLLFSNMALKVSIDTAIAKSDHLALHVSFSPKIENKDSIKKTSTYYNYNLTDFDKLNISLLNIDWEEKLLHLDAETAYEIFYQEFMNLLHNHTPIYNNKKNNNYIKNQPWINRDLIKFVKIKNTLHKIWITNKSPYDYMLYKSTRTHYKKIYNTAKNDYFHNIQINLSLGNSAPFWNYINKYNKKTLSNSTMVYDNTTSSDNYEIANLFQSFFSAQYNDSQYTYPTISSNNSDSIELPIITTVDIYNALIAIKSKSILTPDDLPLATLKNTIDSISRPLSIIFNLSLSSGIFPSKLKQSLVLPKFKKGNTTNIENYRPISILSNISKIFEKIILKYLSIQLYPFMSDSQHGFFHKRSTVTNLSNLTHDISCAFDKCNQIDVFYSDYSKAFDSVNHKLLIYKLQHFNLSITTIKLITNYLSNRTQKVLYNNTLSLPSQINSGVVQGSILGPFLFSLFVNDLPNYINCKSLMFADDAKIFLQISTSSDILLFQNCIMSLEEWSTSWGLTLNLDKCSVITFSRKTNTILYEYRLYNTTINRVQNIKDLGVLLTSDMRFNLHCQKLYRDSSRRLGYFKRITSTFRDTKTIFIIYNIFIRSKLEYATTVWNCTTQQNIDLLESLQYKFLRYIAFKSNINYSDMNYTQICLYFGIEKLYIRRARFDLIYLYKLLNNYIDNPILLSTIEIHHPTRVLRNNPIFDYKKSYHNYPNMDVIFRTTKICNKQQISPFTAISIFKKNVNLFLENHNPP